MKWSSWSPELPPKLDYAGMSEGDRELGIWFGMEHVQQEFGLYKRTGNGAHMWRCYQLWRRLMPEDLPLPRELLAYLDGCADAVAAETDPSALKLAMQLTKSPRAEADRPGGPTGATAADPVRRERNVADYVRAELFRAHIRGQTQRGHKGPIYAAAMAKFGIKRRKLQDIVREWQVDAAVEHDMEQWRNLKVQRTSQD